MGDASKAFVRSFRDTGMTALGVAFAFAWDRWVGPLEWWLPLALLAIWWTLDWLVLAVRLWRDR